MDVKEGLFYTKNHEWLKKEGELVYVGITDYAQDAMGDIVFVELPEKGSSLEADSILGVVESVKAASDVYCPVRGTVTDVNSKLEDEPGSINSDPYGSWIAVVETEGPEETNEFLSADEYRVFCEEEG